MSIATSMIMSFFSFGFCCAGPLGLFTIWAVFSSGIREYDRLIDRLDASGRVCHVCGAVALYGDERIEPSKRHGDTREDLEPTMHVIREDGERHVLCEACLEEVKAMDTP